VADFLFVALRALAFVAVLQAAGVPLYLWLFEERLRESLAFARRLGWMTAITAILATAAAHLAQPARMTGTLEGLLDGTLHAMLLASDAGASHAIRILGLVFVLVGLRAATRLGAAAGVVGATLIAASFALLGHTATHDQRWLLAPLLVLHVLIAAFWFGALLPLRFAGRHETAAETARLLAQFSAVAAWLVPIILVAGIGMAVVLLSAPSGLVSPYGFLLMGKLAGFAILMGLAGLNKWRLGPLIGAGRERARDAFRIAVTAEWLLIAAVLAATAVMTALYSPPGAPH
jgi:putative copper export protein